MLFFFSNCTILLILFFSTALFDRNMTYMPIPTFDTDKSMLSLNKFYPANYLYQFCTRNRIKFNKQ